MQKNEVSVIPESGQAAETRLYTYTVGICATGRPPRLQRLLATILDSEMPGFALRKVVLVASECSEETLTVARKAADGDWRIKLIEHERRTGKADAINEVFREAEGDFLVYVNADALVGPGSIPALLKGIEQDTGAGFVSGMPVFQRPQGLISTCWTSCGRPITSFLRTRNQRRRSNHGTDELMAIRCELLPELPHGVVNDGAYIAGRRYARWDTA